MWEENPNWGNPHNQVGTEIPIHMQGSCPGFEPGSTEVKGREETTEPTWSPLWKYLYTHSSFYKTRKLNEGES